ncbi:Hypothetical_protein [Hexamita inflata]|uniref:Hypothetical_protein n=1 Tax=Hexamita inflata TaxID=28002 RepID=A0AA86Q6S7_9EUKA|nr:Hypothetical protein HINF_LOCUS39341 [Hexamita inflata]
MATSAVQQLSIVKDEQSLFDAVMAQDFPSKTDLVQLCLYITSNPVQLMKNQRINIVLDKILQSSCFSSECRMHYYFAVFNSCILIDRMHWDVVGALHFLELNHINAASDASQLLESVSNTDYSDQLRFFSQSGVRCYQLLLSSYLNLSKQQFTSEQDKIFAHQQTILSLLYILTPTTVFIQNEVLTKQTLQIIFKLLRNVTGSFNQLISWLNVQKKKQFRKELQVLIATLSQRVKHADIYQQHIVKFMLENKQTQYLLNYYIFDNKCLKSIKDYYQNDEVTLDIFQALVDEYPLQ